MKNTIEAFKKRDFGMSVPTPIPIIDLSGIVVDHEGNPIVANVIVQGTAYGVLTDFDGSYYLPSVPKDAIVEFSFQGIIHKVPAKEVGNVVKINTSSQLDEIVITATKPKKINYLGIGLGIAFLIGVIAVSTKKKPIKVAF